MVNARLVRERSKLEWLEVMRGVAACWVVLHHASLAVQHFIGPLAHGTAAANGHLGVDFFFVLSGFIIALSSEQLLARGGGLRAYVRARFLRIYVPYWPIGAPLLAVYLAFPGLSAAARDIGVFTSLTLLPSNHPPALSVAWTLVHEVIFYAVYATYFVSRRANVLALTAWVSLIVLWWFSGEEAGAALAFFVSPRNLSFIAGLLVFEARRFADGRAFTTGDLPALVLGTAVVAWQALKVPDHALATIGFACLVFAGSSRVARQRALPSFLVKVGAASYAIYLVHNPLLSVLIRVAQRLQVSAWSALALSSVLAIAAGLFYWRFIETPALRWARARVVAD